MQILTVVSQAELTKKKRKRTVRFFYNGMKDGAMRPTGTVVSESAAAHPPACPW